MKTWTREHGDDQEVQSWISSHPAPPEWEGSDTEWAFTEMPQPGKVATLLVGLGLAAITGFAIWSANRSSPPARLP